jgi:hypothetical protein
MNAAFFGLAFLAALNPKFLGLDLLLMQDARPRLMFLCFLLGGYERGPDDWPAGCVRPAGRCHPDPGLWHARDHIHIVATLARRPTIRRSARRGVRFGLACGREDRSAIPAAPACR